MKLAKFKQPNGLVAAGIVEGDSIQALDLSAGKFEALSDLLDAKDIPAAVDYLPKRDPHSLDNVQLLPPIDRQEVWAAGVTYKRSQTARMEESEAAASCYDRVYVADRPELFLKATPHRVRGEGQELRIRTDATWNVPEPEVTLVLNSRMQIVGYTIGNDMSSRDIEGENPLYLPQAKVYDQCAGLGPWITLSSDMPPREQMTIDLQIQRGDDVVFEQATDAAQMARSFEDLASWLGRDNSFPNGVFLMTGTGIVPGSDFTLAAGDVVRISIAGIGTLTNSIVQG
ncbi:Fumarylacetoacetate (FAA) hydrolase family protein [Rosistilla carotiformis]|uniref:Fumarylacetoacetate (FAA) hydrolase family protein n=1 Tax=Rosistilla carotiformis TaxID=2528017 RepID=A0A518JQ83_9BACT|nr:fumarylacetoacetate hydrolase family protein [Rosistilla carotiformis]QDV67702.1 Fumarylacetoacetate (FAA) hydrolase family protein [Rosistilla carotiformis]